MAFKLTKAQHTTLEELRVIAATKRNALADSINTLNVKLEELWEPVAEQIVEFNSALTELSEAVEEITEQMHSQWTGKATKWQDSAAGQTAQFTIGQLKRFGDAVSDAFDVSPPDPIEQVDEDWVPEELPGDDC